MSVDLLTKTFTIDRAAMLGALAAVSGVVPSRSPKPILLNVLLAIDPEAGTELIGTNLEVGIRHRVLGVKADGPRRLLLDPRKLHQILSRVPDEEVALGIDGDQVTLSGTRWKFTLPTEDAGAYPEVPGFDAIAYHQVAAADLRRMIRRTAYATDVESTRYALGGTLLEAEDGKLALVGTDGRRLAKQDAPAEEIGGEIEGIGAPVIPIKALKMIERVLADDEGSVHIAVRAANAVLVRTEMATIYARLVEGRYPRYRDVFPASHAATVRTTAGELLLATEQAAITTSEESRGIDHEFREGFAALRSSAADRGSSAIELPVGYEGPAAGVDITFDGRYVAEALRSLEPGEQVELKLLDGKTPAVFETTDGLAVVIMPLTRDR